MSAKRRHEHEHGKITNWSHQNVWSMHLINVSIQPTPKGRAFHGFRIQKPTNKICKVLQCRIPELIFEILDCICVLTLSSSLRIQFLFRWMLWAQPSVLPDPFAHNPTRSPIHRFLLLRSSPISPVGQNKTAHSYN